MRALKVLAFLVALCLTGGHDVADEPKPATLKDGFREHWRQLLILNTDRLHQGSQNALWYGEFLRAVKAGTATTRPAAEWHRALVDATILGRRMDSCYRDSGCMSEKFVVELLVLALREDDPMIREFATRTLARECRLRDLEAHCSDIMKSLKRPLVDEQWQLYGRLPLAEAERKELARDEKAPVEVRARAGAAELEKKLIAEFEATAEYWAKRNLAGQLGYVGSRRCAEALVRGLTSPAFVRTAVDERAVRTDVLLALGQIYQDEPLFTTDARFVSDNGDKAFDLYRGIFEYTRDVDDWALKNFGQKAWDGQPPSWFQHGLGVPIHRRPPK